jgi:hypothetical protein
MVLALGRRGRVGVAGARGGGHAFTSVARRGAARSYCMRKLLTLLNAIAKSGEPWQRIETAAA